MIERLEESEEQKCIRLTNEYEVHALPLMMLWFKRKSLNVKTGTKSVTKRI